ncbi:carboxymuconolactone decarboxylase family protein [Robbsia andropogonis]|uniref:carboxymuconolactone decarboxylase family protein n=1 Tax=Robbsia andropogonis TaxID=28092 RepID=UPI0004B152E6|nr:carboxymuconolactone decarboxylase family protein [Robbsia andropogonis]MCP1120216.1 carboxymuconolactone decarboxylase family protein [Robbsia andropogonis]MCP1130138.1 carboxymuconolactone decarboxylase family protein [Robbsia andropogonis]
MTQIRVPIVTPGTNPEIADLEETIKKERGGKISLLYQVLLNSPAIAGGWEHMLSAVRNRSTIPADLRELAILRVAVLNRANYEFEAHIPHALNAGISANAIEAVRNLQEIDPEPFSEIQRLVVELTDRMTRDVDVSDAVMARVSARFNAQEVVELVATIAAYNMVSRFLVALAIAH